MKNKFISMNLLFFMIFIFSGKVYGKNLRKEIKYLMTKNKNLGTPLRPINLNLLKIKDFRQRKKMVLLVFGDSGTGKKDQYDLAKFMWRECQKHGPSGCDLSLVMGDLIYQYGFNHSLNKNKIDPKDLEQIKQKFEKPYAIFGRKDFWLAPGNHDWRGNMQLFINYSLQSQRWRIPNNHYFIPKLPDWLNIYVLDTTRIKNLKEKDMPEKDRMVKKNNHSGEMGDNYLTENLCGKKGWRMIMGHHAMYTSGFHGTLRDGSLKQFLGNFNVFRRRGVVPEIESILLPQIEKCKIQVFLAGHDHHMEHLIGIDKKNGRAKFHQILQGSASKIKKSLNKRIVKEVKSLFKAAQFGFSIIVATPELLDVSYFSYPPGSPDKFKKVYQFNIPVNDINSWKVKKN